MFEAPLDLSKARILLSNDDGIRAHGLTVLERIARTLSDDIWIVAPETEQSGAGHSLSLHDPIRIRQYEERRFSVSGSPTDAVLIGITKLMADTPPDLVLSGVNRGANLGEDVTYSGTVAAAMEATLLGYPAIALSQVRTSDQRTKWDTAERHAAGVVRKLVQRAWPTDVLFNVNFPDIAAEDVHGPRMVRQGRRTLGYRLVDGVDPRGVPYLWIGPPRIGATIVHNEETDLTAVGNGHIAITPLQMDMTHDALLSPFQELFA
jgi:5'-nucleotidase